MSMNIALKEAKGIPGERAVAARGAAASGVWPRVRRVLMPLASLKFTVVLFAMAIFLVFTGTLVQKQIDIWEVIHDWFRIDERKLWTDSFPWFNFGQLFVRIPLDIFCIDLFFSNPPKDVTWGIWFPRGWLIGLMMGVNLLAAHTVRFTVQARGYRLWGGLATLAAGCVVTWAVIESGSSESGILRGSELEWGTLWKVLLMGLATLSFVAAVGVFQLERRRVFERVAAGIGAAAGFGLLIFALYYSTKAKQMLIGPESMRILWQLTKGTIAGLVLLAGCWMVFKKRAGIVLLHGGIGLMFLYEVVVGTSHDEAQMEIVEGGSSNWVQDVRSPELVVVTRQGDQDKYTIIPQNLLEQDKTVSHPELPFDIRITEYMKNCAVVDLPPIQQPTATRGAGLKKTLARLQPSNGASQSSRVDYPGMYVTLLDKQSGADLGKFLVSVGFPVRQTAGNFDDGERFLEMRFRRTQKPYVIHANEIRADQYVASNKFRNYSSEVRVVDEARHLDQVELIKMNSPMRFAGETFYQSNYREESRGGVMVKVTTLSVVKNAGWMLPYVSCMIVGVGMLAQFGVSLTRFLNRRRDAVDLPLPPMLFGERTVEKPKKKARKGERPEPQPAVQSRYRQTEESVAADAPTATGRVPRWVVPVVACSAVFAFMAYEAMPPKPDSRGMDLAAFGRLPMAGDARVKPFEAQARAMLSHLSHKQTFKFDPNDKKEKSKPAVHWLLDLMTGKNAAKAKVFRIEDDRVIKLLGLPSDTGFLFSFNQIMSRTHEGNVPEINFQLNEARDRARAGRPLPSDRELFELENRLREFRNVQLAFEDIPALMNFDPLLKTSAPDAHSRQVVHCVDQLLMIVQNFQDDHKPPLAVPVGGVEWRTVSEMNLRGYLTDPARKSEVDEIFRGMDVVASRFQQMLAAAPGIEAKREFAKTIRAVQWLHDVTDGVDVAPAPDAPAATKMAAVLQAYRFNDAAAFNAAVADYRDFLNRHPPSEYDAVRADREAALLHWEPFSWCSWIYVVAGVLALGSWLKYRDTLNAAAFWMIVATFTVQTVALIFRIYVTKRPPVTNLYSSAVFIGWGAVLTGIILERVYRLGVGNVLAAVAGFGSLQIAHILARQGDTIGSLDAVLDTQFWLTTHVVCITLGYAATYVAGIIGVIYVLLGVVTPGLTKDLGKDIARMIYGTLCFALFLSFVGTVLGGLWADDSWGRFWGWDPKENGALIIVLWNALVLHARWDGMVKDRGLAVLAVGGNITTSWSWFGVNQLGVGLHSYGFSQALMNMMTGIVIASVLTIIVGMLPKDYWMSGKQLQSDG